jgi:hypothetical protein
MKQILFVGAGKDFPAGAFNFLLSMQDEKPVSVQGLFFSPIDYKATATASQLPVQGKNDRMIEREREAVTINKTLFAGKCQQHHIRYHVHEYEGQWDKHLLTKESRFADLILLSGELFYGDVYLPQPNVFLQEALQGAECPVFVIPEDYVKCEHLFMAYDGSTESVFAIKQFAYLFPQYTDLPAEVVYVKEESSDHIPDMEHLRHYTQLHFACMGFSKLHSQAAYYFANWIAEHEHVMLVAGSYGRSPFSYLAKRSFAEIVIKEHKIPVFIAHA